MRYMLLIHHGAHDWESLSADEQKQADDLDAAIELASRIPPARLGGGVEVRPLKGS